MAVLVVNGTSNVTDAIPELGTSANEGIQFEMNYANTPDSAPALPGLGSYQNNGLTGSFNFGGQTCTLTGGSAVVQTTPGQIDLFNIAGTGDCNFNGYTLDGIGILLTGFDNLLDDQFNDVNLNAGFEIQELRFLFLDAMTGKHVDVTSEVVLNASYREDPSEIPIMGGAELMVTGLLALNQKRIRGAIQSISEALHLSR